MRKNDNKKGQMDKGKLNVVVKNEYMCMHNTPPNINDLCFVSDATRT